MSKSDELDLLDARIMERAKKRKEERLAARNPQVPVIDVSPFAQPLSDLSWTLIHKVEREATQTAPDITIPIDKAVILRQLVETYNLIRFINADETRFGTSGYRQPYSFVMLPLVRTMIDGFYNCTALLDDPSRSRKFRISGYYRMREALRTDEAIYGNDPGWIPHLSEKRSLLQQGMRVEGIADADLDDKHNQWPLLGTYLKAKPDTPHKQMLQRLTLGFWKEYSSVSHASFDGLAELFQFIATDRFSHERRAIIDDNAERLIAVHYGRASGVLLCLLTEIQHFYKFDGADINQRLGKMWKAIIQMLEVRELFDYRYKALLKDLHVDL